MNEIDSVVEDLLVDASKPEEEIDIDSLKTPVRISVGKKALSDHQRIVNRLGIYGSQEYTPLELERYLQQNGYSVYPLESVTKYMAKKVSELGGKKVRRNGWGSTTTTVTKWRWVALRMAQAKDKLFCKQIVPVEVLMTVEKIFNDLGDRVTFEVTEIYKSTTRTQDSPNRQPVHGDPFMCVRVGSTRYVLERWDEPGFRS